jgi:hypothetical protein
MATQPIPANVEFKGSSGLAGGWALDLKLQISAQQQIAFGDATISQGGVQGGSPYQFRVSGPLITMATMKSVHFGLRLSSPAMPGRHIDINAVIDGNWNAGTAIVNAWLDTPQPAIVFQVNLERVG